jgi:hypothetical protein
MDTPPLARLQAENLLRTLVLPVLRDLSNREVARRIDVDDKTIAGIRKGTRPRRATIERLWALATEIAVGQPVEERSPEAAALLAEAKVRTVE